MASTVVEISRQRIEGINTLPTIPSQLQMVSSIIEKPRVTLDEIGRFIANDPALTSKVLKMVNSAAYGFPGRVSSISHSVMLLGLNVIKGLLLGVSVFEIMEKMMKGLWRHSLGCAVAARAIAEIRGLKDPEEVSIGGLLHDLGKVIMVLEHQKQYEEAMEEANTKGITIADAEELFFTHTHAAIGMWLAEKWHFPRGLIEIIAFHHHPTKAKLAPLEAAIVHVADILVRSRGLGFAGDPFVPPVSPPAFELLKLSREDIKEILTKLEKSSEETGEEM